jgi:hypothetical protein
MQLTTVMLDNDTEVKVIIFTDADLDDDPDVSAS